MQAERRGSGPERAQHTCVPVVRSVLRSPGDVPQACVQSSTHPGKQGTNNGKQKSTLRSTPSANMARGSMIPCRLLSAE